MKKLAAILLLAMCASAINAQAPSDVPRDHWAYEAVKDLIDKGYMEGYADGRFLGERTLTRYELAAVIKRIIDGVSSRLATSDQKPTTPGETTNKNENSVPSAQDLAKLQALIGEFKPELAVLGTRIEAVENAIARIVPTLDKLNSIITDPEGAFETAKSDLSKLKKITVSGYVQARFNLFQGDLNSATTARPPANFSVRRARVKFAGRPTSNSLVVYQLDGGQNYLGTSPPAVTTKDAYLQYDFAGEPSRGISMIMGQTKWPFGYEVVQSSAVRESPERSLIVQRFFPGERDRGVYASYPFLNGKVIYRLGLFNGVQASQTPPISANAGVSTVRVKLGDIDFGASAWYGKGIENSAGKLYYGNLDPKARYGADIQWYLSSLSLKAEYMTGVGVDGADGAKPFNSAVLHNHVDGGWAQAAWNFTKADTLAVKWETMSEDPLYPQFGRRSAWNLGLLHWLDDKTRVKLYYIINEEENKSFGNNAFITEWITVF